MKTTIIICRYLFILLILLANNKVNSQTNPPLTVNTTPVTYSCNLGSYGQVTFSVPAQALTGDNILLEITLPGILSASPNCTKTVTITNTPGVDFVTSPVEFPFAGGSGIYTNAGIIDPNNGQNFNVIYQFPGGVTCNGTIVGFTVKVEVNCDGVISTCEGEVQVEALAAKYWTITKEFVTGNLACGTSHWRFRLKHDNPNGSGLGTYYLTGTITETTSLPVIDPPSGFFSISPYWLFNGETQYDVQLQNCAQLGAVITNTADYQFSLGNSCEVMSGSLSVDSPPLAAPSPSISFTKYASANGGIFLSGCGGYYNICVTNNGNTPWTDLQINDNFTIPGINITDLGLGYFTESPPGALTGPVEFTAPPGFSLDPGEGTCLTVYFDITGNSNTIVTNKAYLQYAGGGGVYDAGNPSPCPGYDCPTVDASIQNTSVTTDFTISESQPIPSICKCNEPNPFSVPIKNVGEHIKFRIQVGNAGSAPLNTTITDPMATTTQDLEIIPGSITYTYFPHQSGNYCGNLSGPGVPFSSISGTSASFNNDILNPVFTINGLPGDCSIWYTNIVVIEFEAQVKPQLAGSKINMASMGNLTSQANYTVDLTGELQIDKMADQQIVETGDSFNYIITVTNMGSDPLNNIVMTDALPSCIVQNGTPTVTRGSQNISSTSSGNIVIAIASSEIINPGESFVITLPVKKINGTICCNNSATVTGNMVNNNVALTAATSPDEIACVQSGLCCDIDNVSIYTSWLSLSTITNQFSIHINGGSVPIQEIEISMLDYHVTYLSPDCQPTDMGIFGNIFSPNLTVGGLSLNNNNTHSVSWLPGTPFLLNDWIICRISRPAILNLPCCNGTLHFCLKVRLKDINCNVCEKIICRSFRLNDNYVPCPGKPWTITRFPGSTVRFGPGMKNQYDKTISEQQQRTETEDIKRQQEIEKIIKTMELPQRDEFIKNLNRTGSLKIDSTNVTGDVKPKNIDTKCLCNQYSGKWVAISQNNGAVKKLPCGGSVTYTGPQSLKITATKYLCTPITCLPTYHWYVQGPVSGSGTGQTFIYNFSTVGNYSITITPMCGITTCAPCQFKVKIN